MFLEKKNKKWQLSFKQLIPVIIIFFIAMINGVFVYASQVKEVEIDNKGSKEIVKTMGKTVMDVLSENGIVIGKDDILNLPLNSSLGTVTSISIKSAVKKEIGTLNEEGMIKNIDKANNNKSVNENNQVKNVILKDKISSTQKNIVIKNKLPYKVVKKVNNKMKRGETKVVKQGKEGLEEKTYKVFYRNGKEVSRKYIGTKIVIKPVNKVVEEGTRFTYVTSRGDTLRCRKVFTMRATAYDNGFESTGKNPGDRGYGITASGMRTKKGVVAVDPRVIPLGSRLYIESAQKNVANYGYAVAADTGGAIKGNKIDLFFETRREVNNWGVRNVKVYVLE